MIGGNTRASAVLLTAPTSDMKRPSSGIASARMTETSIALSKSAANLISIKSRTLKLGLQSSARLYRVNYLYVIRNMQSCYNDCIDSVPKDIMRKFVM